MKVSPTTCIALLGLLVFASAAAAQPVRTPQAPSGDTVGVAIAVQVGGELYQYSGQASCTHAARASIYALPAQQWMVRQADGSRSIGLTFWRPVNGSGDMFTLTLSNAGKSYMTSTVKVNDQGAPQGAGTATFVPADAGGTFTLNAVAGNGGKMSGTIRCDAFRAAVAEGGL